MVENRDQDLEIIDQVSRRVSTTKSILVLTGSYAFEALTQQPLKHNDIDGNVFTSGSVLEVRTSLNDLGILIYKSTQDRLEFDIRKRRIELCLYNYDLPTNIPITNTTLTNSHGKVVEVKVKSLPYSIATWAIRISGNPNNPKRPLRESDIANFSILVSQPFQRKEVLNAMNKHIQMPVGRSEEEILNSALLAVGHNVR